MCPPGRSSLTRLICPPDVIWMGCLPLGHRERALVWHSRPSQEEVRGSASQTICTSGHVQVHVAASFYKHGILILGKATAI